MTLENATNIERMLDYAVLQFEISSGAGLNKPIGAAVEICRQDEKPIIFESSNINGNPISEIHKILRHGRALSEEFKVRTICIATEKHTLDSETSKCISSLIDGQVERPSIYIVYPENNKLESNKWVHRRTALMI